MHKLGEYDERERYTIRLVTRCGCEKRFQSNRINSEIAIPMPSYPNNYNPARAGALLRDGTPLFDTRTFLYDGREAVEGEDVYVYIEKGGPQWD